MRKKYATTEDLDDLRCNDIAHIFHRLSRIEGKLWVLVPLVVATFILVITLLVMV